MSLRTFGWLCAREGAFLLLRESCFINDPRRLRFMLMRMPLDQVRSMTRSARDVNPYRES